MGHGHDEQYEIPNYSYKIYKVEDFPQLLTTRAALVAQELSNPWLRKEVSRYNAREFGTGVLVTFGRCFG